MRYICTLPSMTHIILVLLQQAVGAQQRVAQALHAVHALAARRRGRGDGCRNAQATRRHAPPGRPHTFHT
jgi:hypothetical protein